MKKEYTDKTYRYPKDDINNDEKDEIPSKKIIIKNVKIVKNYLKKE